MIRMSGMNSGLDTESIINALTANTKLKATKQERNVLKYEATQEAYRDIISKMQNIKNSSKKMPRIISIMLFRLWQTKSRNSSCIFLNFQCFGVYSFLHKIVFELDYWNNF